MPGDVHGDVPGDMPVGVELDFCMSSHAAPPRAICTAPPLPPTHKHPHEKQDCGWGRGAARIARGLSPAPRGPDPRPSGVGPVYKSRAMYQKLKVKRSSLHFSNRKSEGDTTKVHFLFKRCILYLGFIARIFVHQITKVWLYTGRRHTGWRIRPYDSLYMQDRPTPLGRGQARS